MTTKPLSKESASAPEMKPQTPEGKRAMEQAHDAIENVSEGYGNAPSLGADVDAPATPDSPNRSESPAEGGAEPTHVTVRDSDRR